MVITDSVVAWYSSSSINSSWDHASPWKSWWSRSCCRGGAFGSSWLTTSRLILGACFRRSLLRICDLIVSNLSTLLCSLQTQAEHSWEPASSSSRDNPESVGVSLAEGSSRLGSSLPDWPRETSTVKHNKKLYLGIMMRKHQIMQLFFFPPSCLFTGYARYIPPMCVAPCFIPQMAGISASNPTRSPPEVAVVVAEGFSLNFQEKTKQNQKKVPAFLVRILLIESYVTCLPNALFAHM